MAKKQGKSYFLATFGLLFRYFGVDPQSHFWVTFFVTLNFLGFRALWDLWPLITFEAFASSKRSKQTCGRTTRGLEAEICRGLTKGWFSKRVTAAEPCRRTLRTFQSRFFLNISKNLVPQRIAIASRCVFQGLTKGWFSKRVVLAEVPPEREPKPGNDLPIPVELPLKSRRRTNVQQLTCKMVWSFSFYSLLFSFGLFELKQ